MHYRRRHISSLGGGGGGGGRGAGEGLPPPRASSSGLFYERDTYRDASDAAGGAVAASSSAAGERVGVLLLNLGGPETLEDVQPFLYNLFADPDIIRLPEGFQFAQPAIAQLVSSLRTPKVGGRAVGVGGGARRSRPASAARLSWPSSRALGASSKQEKGGASGSAGSRSGGKLRGGRRQACYTARRPGGAGRQLLRGASAALFLAAQAREGYQSIGGGSPLRRITEEQAEALERALQRKGLQARCYVAMRYWKPFTGGWWAGQGGGRVVRGSVGWQGGDAG